MSVLGVLLLLTGCVWFLQGINIIPGSFMTGDPKWAFYGGVSLIAGLGLLLTANRPRRR